MEKANYQPFEVGQLSEARSFLKGYRGAWFRCKIIDIKEKDGHLGHVLRYLDFPDEKDKWIRLYQIPPIGVKKRTEVKRQIMVRPVFPPIYRESQMPVDDGSSEVIVITEGIWNVGDLVDWWKDGCYWSGKVTKILGNEEAMVELMPPPMGEGSLYKVYFSDLRPSLDWSLEDGWKLPTPKDGGNCRQCARLVHPVNQSGGKLELKMPTRGEGTREGEVAAGLSSAQAPPHVSTKSVAAAEKLKLCGASEMLKETHSLLEEVMGEREEKLDFVLANSGQRKTSCSDSSYKSHVGDGSNGSAGPVIGEDLFDSSSPQKKLRTNFGISLNSTRSDTLEAAIMDLEELANKIKWLKRILKQRSSLSHAVETSWTYVEHRGPSML